MKLQHYRQTGFTVLELIIGLCLISLLLGVAVIHYNSILMREERTLSLQYLQTAIEFAKTEAFRTAETITVCMSMDQKTCVTGKGISFIIFKNKEKNAQPKPENILQVGHYLSHGTLEFRGFGNHRTSLDIESNGFTHNNGHFCYCPKNQNPKEADGLIINKASRSYRPYQRDRLGVLEIDKNTSLSCF